MELIYFAKSKEFPNLIKIGRTDRDVQSRMNELSAQNYGPEGFEGNADWEAVGIIEVHDNEAAEVILHEHFSELRVSESRELFFAEDAAQIIDEGTQKVDGEIFLETIDWWGSLDVFDLGPIPLGAMAVAGMSAYASLNPNSDMARKSEIQRETRDQRLKKNTEVLLTPGKVNSLTRAAAGLSVLSGLVKKGADAAGTTAVQIWSELSEEVRKEIESTKRASPLKDVKLPLEKMAIKEILFEAQKDIAFPQNFDAQLKKWKLDEHWLNKCEERLGDKRLHPLSNYRSSKNFYRKEALDGNPIAQLAIASAIGNLYEFRPDIHPNKIPKKFFTGSPPSEFRKYLWMASRSGLWAACLTLANFLMHLPERKAENVILARSVCRFALLGNGNSKGCNVRREELELVERSANKHLSETQLKYSDFIVRKLVLDPNFKGSEVN
ncbi:MAG: GIY-YIG nuclease family protein [Parvibaculales bacterium]